MAEAKLKIDGMSCGHCVSRVKQAIDGLSGVIDSAVEIGLADITFDESKVSVSDIETAVEKAGYKIRRES